MKVIAVTADYAQSRAAAYPEIGDQLDAVMKTLDAIINRKPLPADAADVISKMMQVKAMYPKPAE